MHSRRAPRLCFACSRRVRIGRHPLCHVPKMWRTCLTRQAYPGTPTCIWPATLAFTHTAPRRVGDARAHPPDRGQGAAEAAPPQPQPRAARAAGGGGQRAPGQERFPHRDGALSQRRLAPLRRCQGVGSAVLGQMRAPGAAARRAGCCPPALRWCAVLGVCYAAGLQRRRRACHVSAVQLLEHLAPGVRRARPVAKTRLRSDSGLAWLRARVYVVCNNAGSIAPAAMHDLLSGGFRGFRDALGGVRNA